MNTVNLVNVLVTNLRALRSSKDVTLKNILGSDQNVQKLTQDVLQVMLRILPADNSKALDNSFELF
jgi:hypothetical protein